MGGININSGGGGVALGDGSVATGVGGSIHYSSANAQFSKSELSDLVAALGALKAALVSAGLRDATAWAARVGELEQQTLNNGGRVDERAARTLLSQVRFAGIADQSVTNAVMAASPLLRRESGQPADVFISYKREDRARVLPVAETLRRLGFKVWIDDELTPGGSFTDQICDEIERCRAQLVCWTKRACASDWVRGEAEMGRRRGVLVCAQMEACSPQPPFNMLHAEDLSDWNARLEHSGWSKIAASLGAKCGRNDTDQLARLVARGDRRAIDEWRALHPNDPFSRENAHG